MKKQEKSAGPGSRPGSASSVGGGGSSAMGMKHSKSDHSTLAGSHKTPGGRAKEGGPGKKYLSKSHENLAGQGDGEGKLSVPPSPSSAPKAQGQGTVATRAGSSSRPSSADKNKENMAVQDKDRCTGFVKPKQPKSAGMTTIRKASSTQR